MTVSLKTKPVTKSTTSSDLALIEVTKSITSSPDLSPVSSTSSSSGWHVTQKTLELTVTKVTNTFCRDPMSFANILKGHSSNSSTNVSSLFKVMFPDSKIVASFALDVDKLHYLITYGIAPYFYEFLKVNVNNSDCYTVSFDESLNRISRTS